MNPKPIRVFLADDDEDDRELFHEALNSIYTNCELITVSNGEKAINFFMESNYVPDFVFLDINMPKKNGIECLKFIRQLYAPADLHVIMLSTSSTPNLVEQSYHYGATLYVQKPSRFADLVRYLQYCLHHIKDRPRESDFVLNDKLKEV